MRVLIMPTGWQKEIVAKTVFKMHPDKAVLLVPRIEKKEKKTQLAKIDSFVLGLASKTAKELKKFTQVEFAEVNYADFSDVFQKISKIIRREKQKGNKVFVNIAGGSKLLAAVLLTAASLYGIEAYYSIPQRYRYELLPPSQIYQGVGRIIKIPVLPLRVKVGKKNRLLSMLGEKPSVTVKEYVARFPPKDENKARAEFNYYARRLADDGLAKIIRRNGRNVVQITETGKLCFLGEENNSS